MVFRSYLSERDLLGLELDDVLCGGEVGEWGESRWIADDAAARCRAKWKPRTMSDTLSGELALAVLNEHAGKEITDEAREFWGQRIKRREIAHEEEVEKRWRFVANWQTFCAFWNWLGHVAHYDLARSACSGVRFAVANAPEPDPDPIVAVVRGRAYRRSQWGQW